MFTQIYNALVKFFCGPTPSQPSGGHHHQPHRPDHGAPQQQEPGTYPPTPQKPPHKPVSHKPPSRPHGKTSDNEINSANEHYKSLRARAIEEGDRMASSFAQSKDAYNRGDHAAAKQFSTQGKEAQRRMEELNKDASDWIYRENNLDSQADEIDLHGLYVKEAIARTEQGVESARRRGDTQVKLIVGKGLHSASGAKIRPAIEDLMKKYQLDAEIDPSNAGVLIVRFNTGGRSRMGADEISRRIERKDESCAIM